MRCEVVTGDSRLELKNLQAGVAQTCVTSPPYFGLRDYGIDGQIGREQSPEEYVQQLVEVFREVKRVLRDDGTLWVNLGDSYANDSKWGGSTGGKHASALHGHGSVGRGRRSTGLPAKSLIGIPWRVAFALQDDGWTLRQDIIWSKPNPMPESVRDRCVKAHEYIFLLSKGPKYFFDYQAIREDAVRGSAGSKFNTGKTLIHQGGRVSNSDRVEDGRRNKRSVWTVAPFRFAEAHFATFPPALIEPCILAGSRPGDMVLDPFNGAGTTGLVAAKHGRHYWGCELNPEYVQITRRRLGIETPGPEAVCDTKT